MKKITVFTSLLLVFSLISIGAVFASVNSESENVTYRINDKYGDRSYAYGANISVEYVYSNNMFWNTELSLGEADTVITDYDFKYSNRQQSEYHYSGITPYSSMNYSLDRNALYAEGLDKAYKEIYDQTPFGVERTVTVKISDYYEYYPVSVNIHIPGYTYRSIDPADRYGNQSASSKEISKAFNEFFKIPVSDKDTIEITVDKDESDGMSSNTIHTNFFNLSSDCVLGNGTCYIYIGNSNYDNTRADTSLIPGGYGIYAIEYGSDYEYGLDLGSLRNVFPLPENEAVSKLVLDEDQGLMYIFTMSNYKGYIYVVDTRSFEKVQKLETELKVFYHITVGDSFFLLYGDENIEVIEIDSNGFCRTAIFAKDAYSVDNSFHGLYVSAAADFDGERLICVDHLHEGRFRSLELCSFYVSVYNETGLVYYGEYNCSLSANPNPSSYAYNVIPNSVNYISVSWE